MYSGPEEGTEGVVGSKVAIHDVGQLQAHASDTLLSLHSLTTDSCHTYVDVLTMLYVFSL